ncbi:efflux RND transporter permease subunit [Candidatus Gracilibacteria bacterium]|nr:efflux RND transporter permease subunit [Candidatus Gracilibacteria bacterium]
MHSLWIFFLKKRAFTFLLMTVFTLAGLYSLLNIPKESAPEVIIPVGVVSTVLRGASAEDTEKLITDKIEDEVANVENVDKVTSSSREGISIVTAQFNASADIEKSIQDLKDAVDRAKGELPDDATDPVVMKINFADQPMLIISISQDASPAELTQLGKDLEREIKKVKGVSKVIISGTRDKEVQVVVRKDQLAKYGISINQVVIALQSANASLPIGNITVADIDYPIKFSGSIENAIEVPNITIETGNGAPVYLRDIAFIADGLEAPKNFSRISVNGEPSENALTLSIYKKSGGDVTEIVKKVHEKINDLKSNKLLGAKVVITFDAGKEVKRDLVDLTTVGFETVFLVMLMLFLTIGWRESVVAGLSIPLSFVIAFSGLYLSGNTINFMSLFSLILAIGILVDSGIVVAEAIHTRIKTYGNAEGAAVASIKEYGWPLIAGTMTTVAVFAPLFFLSGIVGKFISSIPFTIIFVLMASIVVALGFVPLLAVLLTKDHKSDFEEMQEEWSLKAQTWYKKFLGEMLGNRQRQNRFLASLGIAFIISLSLPITGLLRVSFFPQDDQSFAFVSIERPQGTPLSQTDLSVREVEELLYNNEHVVSFVTTVGASSALMGNGSSENGKLANITVMLRDKDARKLTSTEIVEVLRKDLSPVTSAEIKVSQGNNGPPTSAPVVIKFLGDDLDQLTESADKAERILQTIDGTLDVTTSLRDDGARFEISIDRAKASQVGLSAVGVAQILRTAVSGVTATTIKKSGADIDIIVKADLNADFVNPEDTIKTTIDSIKGFPIATPNGTILLGSIIRTTISQSRAVINHEDKKRLAEVTSNLTPKGNAIEIVNEFKKHEKELAIPDTVEVKYGGDNEEVNRTFGEMALALLAGMAGMLAILVLEFNSFRYAFYLLLTIPFSLIGVFGGLTITGQALSFSSMLGLIALAGVIINHAIILLDSILHKLDHEEEEIALGHSARTLKDVIVDASAVRLRPIFLTTVTTVVGMIPLAGVSALWGPLAFAIMFGLAFAMVLTLVLIPVFFYRYPGNRYKDLKKE